jgi:hypothetical protein
LADVYFTIDGQKYDNTSADTSDWVYGEESFPDESTLAEAHPKELVIPDDTRQICLTDETYTSCSSLKQNHFRYPASWPDR